MKMKEATKENKNNTADGDKNEQHMVWPCHSFLPLLWGGFARSYQGEPSHETWLNPALGLHTMNTIKTTV